MKHYVLNRPKLCAAKCDTADCSKRWTKLRQSEAEKADRQPVLENMSDNCLAYTQPRFTKVGASLKAGEVNK
jgi:hypothetical protein